MSRARFSQGFRRDEAGVVTTEFVLLFPAFIFIMLASIEASIYMARHVMLDRGVDIAVRELRLNTANPPDFDEFKTRICEGTILIQNCEDVVQIELVPVDMTTWIGVDGDALCRDLSSTIDPLNFTNYTAGTVNELMMVRVCALYDPIMPTTPMGLGLVQTQGKHAIVITSAFVNEPSGA